MKTGRIIIMMLSILVSGWITAQAQQDRIEVPGDHFSLEGALELFKKSSSPEEFERLLNSPDTEVNNLDLNGDGKIDYIKVIDRNEGNVHAFIMQAVISANERQDVAVIELEKLANGKAVLQITGDADIYGIETIIEPTEEVRVNAGTSTRRAVVNVWTWPSVQYIYSPYYYDWISPWDWGYYPYWWSSWRPVTYYYYYSRWEPYRPYYSVCHTHRVVYAQRIYRPYRTTSVVVYNRHRTQINDYRSSRQYTSDSNRGRGSSDRYGSNTSYRDNDSRQNSLTDDRNNSRSSGSANSWRQPNDNTKSGSTSIRDHSSSVNKSVETKRNDSALKRTNSNSTNSSWREVQERKQATPGNGVITRQRSTSSFETRQPTDNNRTFSGSQRDFSSQKLPAERKPNFGNHDTGSRQRESRPSFDQHSVPQRSVVQPDRGRSSSGSVEQHRSNSGNGAGKSPIQKRGRD